MTHHTRNEKKTVNVENGLDGRWTRAKVRRSSPGKIGVCFTVTYSEGRRRRLRVGAGAPDDDAHVKQKPLAHWSARHGKGGTITTARPSATWWKWGGRRWVVRAQVESRALPPKTNLFRLKGERETTERRTLMFTTSSSIG